MFEPSGIARFQDHHPDDPGHARIVVDILLSGGVVEPAIVDTGAPWNVLRRAVALDAGLAPSEDDEPTSLMVRGSWCEGHVVRGTVTLLAHDGDDLEISGTFFVPDEEDLHLPTFLGWNGALERVRFAVDPSDNRFAFAPLAPEPLHGA